MSGTKSVQAVRPCLVAEKGDVAMARKPTMATTTATISGNEETAAIHPRTNANNSIARNLRPLQAGQQREGVRVDQTQLHRAQESLTNSRATILGGGTRNLCSDMIQSMMTEDMQNTGDQTRELEGKGQLAYSWRKGRKRRRDY